MDTSDSREKTFQEVAFHGSLWIKEASHVNIRWECVYGNYTRQRDWRKGEFDENNLGEFKEQEEEDFFTFSNV